MGDHDQATQLRLETFSYLPPLDPARVRDQVEHLLAEGWIAAVEHVEPERAQQRYWYMWRLPMFGVSDPDTVMSELKKTRRLSEKASVE